MTYKQLEREITVQIKLYKLTRKTNPWDYETFKNISDELSECLVFFGPVAASLRTAAERAKAERELYMEERRLHWLSEWGNDRGNATKITAQATLDCREKKMAEIEANGNYYQAKEIIDRIDQELNSISRRFKEIKHDSDQKQKGSY